MPSNLITQKEHNITRIKRGAAFLLGLCMALSLYACGGRQGLAGDTEAGSPPETVTSPETEETVTPPSDEPISLSQYIQSSEPQILYRVHELSKDEYPSIYLVQDNTLISSGLDLTLGELSKMSDAEIIQAVMSAEEPPTVEPCTVYVETDHTGNAVIREFLLTYNPLKQNIREIIFPLSHTNSGQIYDSTYTGYWDEERDALYAVRGEQAPFVLDAIGAEGAEVDPKTLDTSFAWIELIDGTRAPLPETVEKGMITSCAMTGAGHTLSLDDVKWTLSNLRSDFSPFALQSPEARARLISSGEWHTETPASEISPHENLIFFSNSFLGSVKFYNASDTQQNLQNLTLSQISITLDTLPSYLEGQTSTVDSSIDSLLREYGAPSGAVMLWKEVSSNGIKYPKAQITYYWAGDGFYVAADMVEYDMLYYLRYVKSGLNEQEVEAAVKRVDGTYEEDRLHLYAEINRLMAG